MSCFSIMDYTSLRQLSLNDGEFLHSVFLNHPASVFRVTSCGFDVCRPGPTFNFQDYLSGTCVSCGRYSRCSLTCRVSSIPSFVSGEAHRKPKVAVAKSWES